MKKVKITCKKKSKLRVKKSKSYVLNYVYQLYKQIMLVKTIKQSESFVKHM